MKRVFIFLLITLQPIFSQNIVTDTIVHELERKETLFSISQKYKINIDDILELNPQLRNSRLKRKSKILIPVIESIQEKTFVEKDSLPKEDDLLRLDSIFVKKRKRDNQLNLSVLLPFRSNTVNYDSIEEVETLFEDRNLYTITLDFYSGILYAIEDLRELNVSINLNVFDTENSINKINEISSENVVKDSDVIIGPLIPRNFETFSNIEILESIPKVFPLSTNPIKIIKGVIQSVTPKKLLRERMIN